MKNLLLAGVAGVALVTGAPADAADLGAQPYKAPPVWAPVPLFTWSGCYIGGHVGGGWGRKDVSDVIPSLITNTNTPESLRVHLSGFLGGGQVGCDYQFAPNWLIGIQGSGAGARIKGDAVDPFIPAKTFHAKTDWLADVTGRVGVVWDRFMLYGKGGVAWAGDKYNAVDTPDDAAFTASETRIGWTAGVGLEWAFWSNWSAFVEYDFYGFGHKDLLFPCTVISTGLSCGAAATRGPERVTQDVNVVKFGINWRFNFGKAPAPVVARY